MEKDNIIPAVRLTHNEKGESFFERGRIRTALKINADEFWFANEFYSWQIGTHIAPCRQFAITLSGKLKFTTSDNKAFILEPGIVLLAEDIDGKGHTWEMIEGYKTWHRIYIPLVDGSEKYFTKDENN